MKQCSDSAQTVRRLKRVEGQIRGIIAMIEADKPCEEILTQVAAAKAALHKAGQRLLEDHLRYCVVGGFQSGRHEETITRLLAALEQFSRLA